MNAFLGFTDQEFTRSMTLVEFYEVAEELIISLQYFNLKQKEENMLKRLNSQGKFEVQFNTRFCDVILTH